MKRSDYNFCNNIVQIPLTYGQERYKNKKYYKPQRRDNRNFRTKRRYFLRRSDNRAPFLHKRNVRRYDPRKSYDKTCRCFICNSPDHLSRTCPNKDQKRYSSKYEEQEKVLIIDSVNENILVCDDEIKDDESIYSIIETDEVEKQKIEEESSEDELDLIDELAGLKIEMMNQVDCKHDWIRGKGDYNIKCAFCIYYPSQENRSTCNICLKQACASCLKAKNQESRQELEYEPEDEILSSRVRNLENRINKLEVELEELKGKSENKGKDKAQEENASKNTELKDQMTTVKEQKGDRLIQLKDALTSFGNKYIVRLPFKEVSGIRIPIKVVLKPNISYKILALLDTGCTKNIIHDKFFARCPELVTTIDDSKAEVSTDMSGIKKLHNQLAFNIESYINGTKYIIDEITIRDLSVINNDMILGLQFLQQSLQTTIIHEDGVTFIPHKDNVPYISEARKQRKSLQNGEITKEDEEYFSSDDTPETCKEDKISNTIEEYFIENACTECIGLQSFSPNWYRDIKSKQDINKIVQRLEDIQIIGEIPMKHWDKNSIVCKINIINPDYIIKTGPIEATPKDIEEFKMHIEELIKLKAIRESRSPHRSAAFIVRNHAEEVRGKSRMVINYKRLNDNTVDDAFNIPNKQEWINRIQGSKYFSKFDLKAGFWQVKMAEESIPWTAFTCPQGHYEWLVMPLGLKNAPALFQRKMQNIFNENQAFILVYVDDLLVFSKSYKEHIAHLETFFRKVEQNGLILSKKKMEICKEKINFLGHEIGEGKIYLQEHIARKILQFPDTMNDKKILQQFLGIVNYARNYIDNLAKLAGPLYAKLRKNGQKYFNSEDIKLVKAIKEKVKYLKPLELPLDDNYLIIETDASQEGWGAILKQKPNKFSAKTEEKICRYASGSYKLKTVNNIDREILAIVHAINAFRLYLGFKEFTVRTDCEAICRYYNQINSKKSSTRRWVLFEDIITGNGYKVVFEHIKGKDNCLPDIFSRSSILQK
jgi:ribonuclease HI/predicted FMN-binding regulatory protein PaiB